MLIGPGGLHVGDFSAFGEAVDDEGVHAVDAGDGDVQEEVVRTGDDEQADHLRQACGPFPELLDDGAGRGRMCREMSAWIDKIIGRLPLMP